MSVAFTASIAGRLDAHQARIHGILNVAFEDAVFDQHVLLAGVAFVIHVERAAPVFDRAVVQHSDAFGGHALADAPAEGAGALAVEVAFQPVANGFVQQYAGPAGAQHDGHFTCRCGA